jgi:hypothetical protein
MIVRDVARSVALHARSLSCIARDTSLWLCRLLKVTALVVGALLLCVSSTAHAQTRHRDRWTQTIAVGGSGGVGGPLGLVGVFVEYRGWRYASLSVGVGAGGSFGPSAGATLSVDPISLRGFSLGVAVNASANLSIIRGEVIPTRPELPAWTAWVGAEAQMQFRPSRSTFFRLGGGYQWLLEVQRFRIASEDELANVMAPKLPFFTPFDAVVAAARGQSFGVPFVHLDLGIYWSL